MRECAREMPGWYRRGLLEQRKRAATMTPQIRPQHLRAGRGLAQLGSTISGRFLGVSLNLELY